MASAFSKPAKSLASRRSSGRPCGPVARTQRLQRGVVVLGQQVEQDRQLGLVVEVAGDDLERVGVEDGEQLVVAQAQQLLQAPRAHLSTATAPAGPLAQHVPCTQSTAS